MKVGFIGFGEVAEVLSRRLSEGGVTPLTCLDGRSEKTIRRAKEAGVGICSMEEIYGADIIISAVTPSSAVKVAQEVGEHVKGLYVDVNNIAPSTVRRALGFIENGRVVDAAIMGSVRRYGGSVKIIASGRHASELLKLNSYGLNIEVRGSEPGDASSLKMLRSSYTKGVSALLWETLLVAYRMGLHEDVIELLGETEGVGFKKSAISRIRSSALHAGRRYEEMREVNLFLADEIKPIMPSCTLKVFRKISKLKLDTEKKEYTDILGMVPKDY